MAHIKNSYQIAQVHTTIGYKGGRRYEFLSAPILGYQNALEQLVGIRKAMLKIDPFTRLQMGIQPSIVYRDQFVCGTEVYRLIKVDPKIGPFKVTATPPCESNLN